MEPVRARHHDLVITHADDDLLMYDQATQELHTLNPLAARVWHLADGQTSPAAMLSAVRATIDPQATLETIDLAIANLAAAGLLAASQPGNKTRNRRTLLKRAAVGGALLPAVISITVPLAAHAASPATCLPGLFETLQACEAGIPERVATTVPSHCTITVDFYCGYLTNPPCYYISGSYTC